jgi:hypothetical protein
MFGLSEPCPITPLLVVMVVMMFGLSEPCPITPLLVVMVVMMFWLSEPCPVCEAHYWEAHYWEAHYTRLFVRPPLVYATSGARYTVVRQGLTYCALCVCGRPTTLSLFLE